MSAFSDGLIGHGLYAGTPDVIHAIDAQLSAPRALEINTVSVIDTMGSDGPPNAAAGLAAEPG